MFVDNDQLPYKEGSTKSKTFIIGFVPSPPLWETLLDKEIKNETLPFIIPAVTFISCMTVGN